MIVKEALLNTKEIDDNGYVVIVDKDNNRVRRDMKWILLADTNAMKILMAEVVPYSDVLTSFGLVLKVNALKDELI